MRFSSNPGSFRRIVGIGQGATAISPQRYTGWSLAVTGTELYWFKYDGTSSDSIRLWTPSLNVWHHVAVSRAGTSLRMFVDGQQLGATFSNSVSYNRINNEDLEIGRMRIGNPQFNTFLDGFIDDIRITKGIARYTKNFLPPPAQLPAI